MSELSAKTRNALPAAEFAQPRDRKYPVDTRARAANAKSRATQQWTRGKLSTEQHEKIIAKANRVLRGARG